MIYHTQMNSPLRRRHPNIPVGFWWGLCLVFLYFFANGCAESQQAREVNTTGFLKDYSMLQPGSDGEAQLVYRNPQADFSRYKTIYVDPVFVWDTGGAKNSDILQEDLDRLADELRSNVMWELKQVYIVVPKLVPGTLRLEMALTEAVPSNVGMDVVTTLVPPARLFSGAKELATGTQAFVGRASVEGKITDTDTGELLFAAVDRRVGRNTLDGSMNSWNDVKQAFRYWATRLSERLRGLKKKVGGPQD